MAPIPHLRGAGSLLNAAIESTFGTSQAAASYSLRVESIEVSTGANRSQIRALGQGSKGFAGPTFVESQTASFTARIVAHYTVDGLATLLRWILWGTWGTTGSGPYTHALTTGSSRIGATMRFNTGTVVGSANDEAVTLVGATVFTASIRVSAPGLMTVEVSGEALSFSRSSTAHSLAAAATTETPVIHHHAGTLAWNSITARLNSFTLNINNALSAVYRLGDLGPGDFAPSGSRTARMTSDLYDGGEGFASSQVDGDTDDAVISFTDGTSTLELTLADAQVAEPVADRISGPGAKVVSVVWASTGDDPLSIELVNANSTAEAA
jgi:hypothetical protein